MLDTSNPISSLPNCNTRNPSQINLHKTAQKKYRTISKTFVNDSKVSTTAR